MERWPSPTQGASEPPRQQQPPGPWLRSWPVNGALCPRPPSAGRAAGPSARRGQQAADSAAAAEHTGGFCGPRACPPAGAPALSKLLNSIGAGAS